MADTHLYSLTVSTNTNGQELEGKRGRNEHASFGFERKVHVKTLGWWDSIKACQSLSDSPEGAVGTTCEEEGKPAVSERPWRAMWPLEDRVAPGGPCGPVEF